MPTTVGNNLINTLRCSQDIDSVWDEYLSGWSIYITTLSSACILIVNYRFLLTPYYEDLLLCKQCLFFTLKLFWGLIKQFAKILTALVKGVAVENGHTGN